jgi:hypothetical protein|tara:strand:+ start:191 stop:382 length:192 start_codon:yes stop_codon:yes gene_type:complete
MNKPITKNQIKHLKIKRDSILNKMNYLLKECERYGFIVGGYTEERAYEINKVFNSICEKLEGV